MKKRLLSLLLVFSMVFSLVVPAYADGEETAVEEVSANEVVQLAANDDENGADPLAEEEQPAIEEPEPLPDDDSRGNKLGANVMNTDGVEGNDDGGDGGNELFTVTFHANGGYFDGDPEKTTHSVVFEGEEVILAPAVENADQHMTFAGWYYDEEFNSYAFTIGETLTFTGDDDLYAKWEASTTDIIVTLDANGGYFYGDETRTSIQQTFSEGDSLPNYSYGAMQSDLSMRFDGWYLDSGCTTPAGTKDTPYYPTDGETFYAGWKKFHTITFVGNGGYFYGDENTTSIVSYSTPGDIMGSNYREKPASSNLRQAFAGWTDEQGNDVDLDQFIPTGDFTLYAKWGEGWIVTLDANGGYFSGNPSVTEKQVSVMKGDKVGNISLGIQYPDDEYLLEGEWSLSADGSAPFNLHDFVPTSDVRVYAIWSVFYLVTLEGNGGYFYGNSNITSTVMHISSRFGTSYIEPPTYSGDDSKVFEGWYFDSDGTELALRNDEGVFIPTQETTLYANWTQTQGFSITYHANGGHFYGPDEPESETYFYVSGSEVGDNWPGGYREGYRLRGFNTEPDGSGMFIEPSFVPDRDMDVYAIWEEAVTITVHANGGFFHDDPNQTTLTIQRNKGEYFNPHHHRNFDINHTNEHMAVEGWYYDAALTQLAFAGGDYDEICLSEDFELYAKWTDGYVVTFYGNGGFLDNPNSNVTSSNARIVVGNSISEVPNVFSRDGSQEGRGWHIGAPDGVLMTNHEVRHYVPTGDVTFYANLVDVFRVTVDANGGYFWGDPETKVVTASVASGEPFSPTYNFGPISHPDGLAIEGWYRDKECTDRLIGADEDLFPDGDMTIYANWVQGIPVTLDAGIGYFGDPNVKQKTFYVISGSSLNGGYPVSVDADDMDHFGWMLEDGTEVDLWDYVVTEEVTLYAMILPCYWITLHGGDGGLFWGGNETTARVSIRQGDEINSQFVPVRNEDPSLALAGWYYDEDLEDLALEYDGWLTPESDLELYAKWLPGFSVTFDGNGGFLYGSDDIPEDTRIVPEGKPVGGVPFVSSADGRKENRGWYLNDPENGEFLSDDEVYNYIPTENVTFYANLVDVYHITLDANGGYFWDNPNETVITASIKQGESVEKNWYLDTLHHPDPDMVFQGWYFDDQGTQPACTDNGWYTPDADITLYAKWSTAPAAQLGENTVELDGNYPQWMTFTPEESGYYAFKSSINAPKYIGVWIDDEYNGDGSYEDLSVVVELQAGVTYKVEVGSFDGWSGEMTFTVEKVDNVIAITFDAGAGYFNDDPEQKQIVELRELGDAIGSSPYVHVDDGYGHYGWMLADGTEIDLWNYIPESDITVYAVVKAGWKLTLNAGEGGYFSNPEETVIEYTERVGRPFYSMAFAINNVDSSLGFDGWYYDEACTQLAVERGEEFYHDEDVILYAKWSEGWQVTFDAGELGYFERDPEMKQWSITVPKGKAVHAEPEVTVEDDSYAFFGWQLADGSDLYDVYEFCPEEDVTIYAQIEPFYALTLYAGEGGYFPEYDNAERLSYKFTLDEPFWWSRFEPRNTDPSLGFAGWYYDEELTQLAYPREEGMYSPTGRVTLYAKWEPGYTVTFNGNGGYLYGSDNITTDTFVVPYGMQIASAPTVSVPEGNKEATGWYINDPVNGEVIDYHGVYYFRPTENVTLYARLSDVYHVVFDANGGYFWDDTSDTTHYSDVTDGTTMFGSEYRGVLHHSNPRMAFAGWYFDKNGTQLAFDINSNFTPSEDTVLYAKWVDGWIVTLNGNGMLLRNFMNGEIAEEFSIAIPKGSSVGSYGYEFNVCTDEDNDDFAGGGGWFENPDQSGQRIILNKYVPTSDVTLYAELLPRYPVTFHAGEGYFGEEDTDTYTKKYTKGDAIEFQTFGASINDDSKVIEGWYLDEEFTIPALTGKYDRYTINGPTDLYAKWTQGVAVTFHANADGALVEQEESYTVKVKSGDMLSSALGGPVNVWHPTLSFAYWCYDAAGNEPIDNLYAVPITESIDVYASFAETVTISWVRMNGSHVDWSNESTVKKGSYIESAPGHIWYWDSACTKPMDPFGVKMDRDITIYLPPNFNSSNSVNVTFDMNGGTYKDDRYALDTDTIVIPSLKGHALWEEAEVTPYFREEARSYFVKEGFAFAGWTMTKDGSDELDFNRSFTKDTTVYAKWVPAFTVTFDGNGKDMNFSALMAPDLRASHSINMVPGQTISEIIKETAMIGFLDESYEWIVSGWYHDSACTDPLDPAETISGDITLYAKWVPSCEVKLDANGGFFWGIYETKAIPGTPLGDLRNLMLPNTYSEDDRFLLVGWSTDRAGGDLIEDLKAFVPDGDVTLYAQWAKGAKVNFYSDLPFSTGYSGYTVQVLDGEAIGEIPALDEGCGRAIIGWYYDHDFTRSAGDPAEIVPTESLTLYAKWTAGELPMILTQPTAQDVYEGKTATFKVVAENATAYQWYYRAGESGDWTAVSSSAGKTATYSFTTAERHDGNQYRCEVSNKYGSVYSDIVTLSVRLKPVFLKHPADEIVEEGSMVRFTALADDATSYQWYYRTSSSGEWRAVSSEAGKTATYDLTTALRHNGYEYRCQATNPAGSTYSNAAKLTVMEKLKITAQPISATVNEDSSVTFKVTAAGADTYQWYCRPSADEEWTAYTNAGGTTASISFVATSEQDGYQFYCEVSNDRDTLSTDIVTLTIRYKPVITSQPESADLDLGDSVVFSVTAEGAESYQWYYRTSSSGSWTTVSSAAGKTADYGFTPALRHNGYEYRCLVSNAAGSVYSDTVTLTVIERLKITEQPENVTVNEGASAAFSITATGVSSYQWYYRTSPDAEWTEVTSAAGKTANYSFTTAARHNGYQYYCEISNATESLSSEIVTLTLNLKPTIVEQPENTTVYETDPVTFKVVAEDAESYQWYYRTSSSGEWKAVSAESGKTAAYGLKAALRHNGYQYRCQVMNDVGSTYTNTVTLHVNKKLVILTTPSDITVNEGATATFTVSATSTDSYQWYYQKPGESEWYAVSAESGKTASYSFTTAARHNGYQYYCELSNDTDRVLTNVVTLTLNLKPTIVEQPASIGVPVGDEAHFAVEAEGADSYQWYYRTSSSGSWKAVSAESGKTADYVLTAALRHNGYQYRCHVTNNVGGVYTNVVTLKVAPKLIINEQPTDQTVNEGSKVTFTVEASGASSYQWYYQKPGESDWTAVSAASGKTASYSFTTAARHNGYQYRCEVMNIVESDITDVVTLTLNLKPTITLQPVNVNAEEGEVAEFKVEAEDAVSYQWYYRTSSSGEWKAVSAAAGKTADYSLTTAIRHNGYQYRCQVTNDVGSVYTSVVTLRVAQGIVITAQPKDVSVKAGTKVSFTIKASGSTSYQWYYQKPGEEGWTAVSASSGKTVTYSLTAEARHNGYKYKCVASNALFEAESIEVTLTVN